MTLRPFSRRARCERGITLIELMVVIAIVALLAVAFMVQLAGARARAVDGRAIDFLNSMRRVMALHMAHHGQYPYGPGIVINQANSGAPAYTALRNLLVPIEPFPADIRHPAVNLIEADFSYFPRRAVAPAPGSFTLVARPVNGTGATFCADPTGIFTFPPGTPVTLAAPGTRCQ